MSSSSTVTALERGHLLEQLASAPRSVSLLGPRGAGKTTVLQQFASREPRAIWYPSPQAGFDGSTIVLIDDAEQVTEKQWSEVVAAYAANPQLRVRIAAHSINAVPEKLRGEICDDLYFTRKEIGEYLSLRQSTASARIAELVTMGHPKSLAIIAQPGLTSEPSMRAALGHAATEPLPRHHSRLSVPHSLTAGLSQTLNADAEVLAEAERDGLGRWTLDVGVRVFNFTPTVRMATQLENPLSPEARRRIHLLAAQQLLHDEAYFGAVAEAAVSGQFEIVDAAIKRSGLTLLNATGPMLLTVLEGTPLRALRRHPITAFAVAVMYNARRKHVLKAVEFFGVALIGAKTAVRSPADRALMKAIESIALRVTNNLDGGLRAAVAAKTLLESLDDEERFELRGVLGDVHQHVAISLFYGGRFEAARAMFERASNTANRRATELAALGGIALTEALRGNVVEAEAWIATTFEQHWPSEMLNEYPGSFLTIAQAKVAIERGDFEAADEALQSLDPILETIEHWPVIAGVRALLDVLQGRAHAGQESFRALRQRRGRGIRNNRIARRVLDLSDSLLSLAVGNRSEAFSLASDDHDSPTVKLGVIRNLIFQDQNAKALELLSKTEGVSPESKLLRLTLQTLVLHRLGREEEAEITLRSVTALVQSFGVRSPLMLIPASERALFADLLLDAPTPLEQTESAPTLTSREQVVLEALLKESNLDSIARTLQVSPNTVKSQKRSLFRKLQVNTREHALARALSLGLLGETTDLPRS
ncbi:LuxR C-terminal-related transcriptional regulator [Humidisolicoccus flavus]|uniref:LuxR C-terminal-related transcriptional regulator n=1 Tax=Humidisolicoccus flavus TaxID=3111414 RepID=UPI0032467DB1